MLNSIKFILRKLAQLILWRYRPAVVGVTGSVGKTSAKTAIAAVLGSEYSVRASRGNFNGEIGLPLTILGDWRKEDLRLISRDAPPGKYPLRKFWFFVRVISKTLKDLLIKTAYPEILILEYGIDRPGDMHYLLGIARPNVGVLTALGETPAHVEFFKGPEEVAQEKSRLLEIVPTTGYIVLNADDEKVMSVRRRSRAQLITFGFEKDATVNLSNFSNSAEEDKPVGIAFKISNAHGAVPVRLIGAFGRANAYAAGAATAVGLIFGMNLVNISGALETYYRPAPHRMELLPGVKTTWILDDSYNAGPLSMRSALDTLKDLPGKRKIAILGDMLEIGEYAIIEHEKLGAYAAKIVDILITVGERGKLIADGARKAGLPRKSIMEFDTAEDAQSPVQTLIQRGDLILIKGSHIMHLDKIVQEIRAFETTA